MYKITTVQSNTVIRLIDGASVPMSDGNIDYEAYKQWLSEGNTPAPEFTDAELLVNAKTAKIQELETAFTTASKLPVKVGIKYYNGGKESGQALRDYIQLVNESGGTTYTIWDTSNVITTYTLAEANAIKLAVATAVANAEFNLRTKKNAVDSATTINAVNSVVF